MADVWGRQEQLYAGGITSDASWMFWAGLANGGLGMLITQMSIQYQQPIRRIYEIGPWTSAPSVPVRGEVGQVYGQPVYYVSGRPEGSLQIGRITGPKAALGGFYKTYGNICSLMNSLFFVSSTGCIGGLGVGGGVQDEIAPVFNANVNAPATNRRIAAGRADPFLGWYMNGVVITNMGLSAQAQDMLVTENIQCMFVSLKLFVSQPVAGGNNGFNVDGNVKSILTQAWKEL